MAQPFAKVDEDATRIMSRFYADLEVLLKRHQPIAYACAVAERMRVIEPLLAKGRALSPHLLLHSIEANCAYYRRQNHDPIDFRRVFRIERLYVNHTDPVIDKLGDEGASLFHFLSVLNRQQLEIQRSYTAKDLARGRLIFIKDDPLPQTSAAFLEHYGLTLDQWHRVCFRVGLRGETDPKSRFTVSQMAAEPFGLSADVLARFVALVAQTPDEIGTRYRQVRDEVRPLYHSLIRSTFVDKPVIDFGADRYLTPLPSLLYRYATEGIYKLCSKLPGWRPRLEREFTESVERHVGRTLANCPGLIRLVGPAELEQCCPGKSCDFLAEFPSCVFLVESKATVFNRLVLEPDVIAQDSSTLRIRDAIVQLYQTAQGLRTGTLQGLHVPSDKPILGCVALFGDIPWVNSEWYRKIVWEGLTERLPAGGTPPEPLHSLPIVLPIAVLEDFVAAARQLNCSPVELAEQKVASDTLADWDRHLTKLLGERGADYLPFVAEEQAEFYATFGVAVDEDRTPRETTKGPTTSEES